MTVPDLPFPRVFFLKLHQPPRVGECLTWGKDSRYNGRQSFPVRRRLSPVHYRELEEMPSKIFSDRGVHYKSGHPG